MDKFWNEVKEANKGMKAELCLLLIFFLVTTGVGIYRWYQNNTKAGDTGHPQSSAAAPVEDETWAEEPEAEHESDGAVSGDAETEEESEGMSEGTEEETFSKDKKEAKAGSKEGSEGDLKAGNAGKAGSKASGEEAEAAGEAGDGSDGEGSEEAVMAMKPWNVLADITDEERMLLPMQTSSQIWPLRYLMPGNSPERTLFGQLHTVLAKMAAEAEEAGGDWSVWVKNLKTGEVLSIGDRPMKSASIMKLFVMGAVYQAVERGELERTDSLLSQLKDMISYSDNEDSNKLLYMLGNEDYEKGIERVNAFIQESGFSDMTIEYNGFNNSAIIYDKDHLNQVSAADCGRILEAIYRREWGSRSISNEIEQMLISQSTRNKIPAGLPDGVTCGNKTGEMDTTENDAAIVFGKRCDYILVVLSSDWHGKDTAVSRIRQMSSKTYQYLEERVQGGDKLVPTLG